MNTKRFLALISLLILGTAQAAPVPWTGSFSFYYCCDGTQFDANDDAPGMDAHVTGALDAVAGTFTLASTDTMYGIPWTASGGTLVGPGTYTISTADPVGASGGDITFTVGSGQLGGWIKWEWNSTPNMDVVMVWDIVAASGAVYYTSTDWDGDGVPGGHIIDGSVAGSNVVFDMAQAAVPLPSALYLFVSGFLGLAGSVRYMRKRSLFGS